MECPFFVQNSELNYRDICCGRAFVALLYVKGNTVAFIKAFKLMHDLRVKLGARPVHVAKYAKKWELFYRFLRKNVMINAVNCAMENGYEAVTCGHTHYPEDRVFNGIRYINTGTWTEFPAFYLQVTGDEMTLTLVERK